MSPRRPRTPQAPPPRKCYRLTVERFDGTTETVHRREPTENLARARTLKASGRRSVLSCEEIGPEDYARETEGRRGSETIRRQIKSHCERLRARRNGS